MGSMQTLINVSIEEIRSRSLALSKESGSTFLGALVRSVPSRKVLHVGASGSGDVDATLPEGGEYIALQTPAFPIANPGAKVLTGSGLDLRDFNGKDLRGLDLLVIRSEPSYALVFSILALYRQFLEPNALVVIEGIHANQEMESLWRDLPFEKVEVEKEWGLLRIASASSQEAVDFFRLRMALYQRPRRPSLGPLDGYATHYAVLAACVARTRGPVLELGCGNYSTPMLHLLCKDRRLVSLDNTAEWIESYRELRSSLHEMHFVEDWEECRWIDEGFWDVVFVDHSPPERRIRELRRLMHRARHIVVHDTEDPCYLFESVLPDFKYRYDYRLLDPWTSVLSNFEPFVP